MFPNKHLKLISLLLGFTAVLSLFVQFFSFRPIQDDYFILGAIYQQGFVALIRSVWDSQGGNLLPYAVNGMLLESSKTSVDFLASGLFLFVTAALVLSASYVFMKWFGISNRFIGIAYLSISLLAFEGIFTPLQIAAFSWHQTSVTHLWPIALTVLSWEFAGSRRFSRVGLIICGLAVGNTNSAEALWSIIATILYVKTFLQGSGRSARVRRNELRYFLFPCVLGFILIFSAPGFWNRANNVIGMPNSLADFGFRFGKSASAFGFDLFTHPYLWLAFLAGILCKTEFAEDSLSRLRQKKRFLIRSSFLLYILLVLGTTLGYPAWHQSLGLYVIMLPTMFILGVTGKIQSLKHIFRFRKQLFYASFVFCLSLSVGSSWLVANRAYRWDSAFQSNVCSIYQGDTRFLKGAEIVYPIFGKGIEDIESWEWMRQSYVLWIESQNSRIFIPCDN